MSLYLLIRSILFKINPEITHHFSLNALDLLTPSWLANRYLKTLPKIPVKVFDLEFANPIGLAAGFDNNGDHINSLLAFGFGFIELGGVTPRAQSGNPKPRLWRLPEKQALINRMGFPNKGVDYLVENLKKPRLPGVVGVNLGKNADTPLENGADDYCYSLERVFPYVDYVTINISSPNTLGLRELQTEQYLDNLLFKICELRSNLQLKHHKELPVLIKISIDTPKEFLPGICNSCIKHGIAGIITSNTSVERTSVEGLEHAEQKGGLSGQPIYADSTAMVAELVQLADGKLDVIGLGGVFSTDDAKAKFAAGAKLVQIYTGFVYQGPGLVKKILNSLL